MAVDRSAAEVVDTEKYGRGRVTPDAARAMSRADMLADMAEDFPEPDAETAAAIERTITDYLRAAGDRLIPESKLRRLFPADPPVIRRDYVPFVVSRMWETGRLWAISVRGRYHVTLGDEHDAARPERARLNPEAALPRVI